MANQAPARIPTFALDADLTAQLARTKPAALVFAGAPGLRGQARAVPQADIGSPSLQRLLLTMVQTMRHAPGVGLAAPQIGVDLAVAVLEDRATASDAQTRAHNDARGRVPLPLCVLINPQIRRLKASVQASFAEGCLSVPHYLAQVRRDVEIEVQGLDAAGTPFVWRPRGWPARIVQHEVDHLRGVLYVDRMASKSFSLAR